ncbi:uncharacterized protein C8A04DRAFT_10072 [Dichotomopilus funicola]|uniref:Glutamine amidotransferase type-2 domain-containing protein n=1 Tax=Dichotomopilus funicola TaxID=1934379 RepID=A0AAN6V7Z3_9PEZI|nr:hypothetical protein C8A04DRAFT_10072 [Dichotomopilus funicola]
MCGIHALITRTPSPPSASSQSLPSNNNTKSNHLSPTLTRDLRARGPDHIGHVERHRPGSGDEAGWTLRFTSTVLALRGDHVARQPLTGVGDSSSVLCWNGEAWRVDGELVEGNDGEVVLTRLLRAIGGNGGGVDAVLDVLRGIEGPFAFVFYDAVAGRVFFGRDRMGRRSLLMALREEGGLELCSVAGESCEGWKEVEADGVYVVTVGGDPDPVRYDWVVGPDATNFVSGIGRFNKALPVSPSPLTARSHSVAALGQQLLESLKLRVLNIPIPPSSDPSGKTRVAVLFSGGLDCAVLARLCHEVLDANSGIDLLNVAFENPRVVAQLRKENSNLLDFYEACPDRVTGRRSFAELQATCPGRAFRFVAVNVPYSETQEHRQQVISVIHPHNTEMDLSIAYALYFAARGQGVVSESPDSAPVTYTSPARVLLSGLGADELFGGYSRHPSAFQHRGYPGLVDELLLDVGRLGKRNLGRDDRAMAHWGKEVRFPFLDERLVKWAIETPAWEKCDFEHSEEDSGVEACKRVLRLLALELGMVTVAREKKRAIQFGARTAKMESGKVKGTTLIA